MQEDCIFKASLDTARTHMEIKKFRLRKVEYASNYYLSNNIKDSYFLKFPKFLL